MFIDRQSPLFDRGLIDSHVLDQIASGFIMRPLEISDHDKGVLEALSHLTTVGIPTKEDFIKRFEYFKRHSDTYFIIVIEDTTLHKIAGCGTMFLERKLIHDMGLVGHLEDVVTCPEYRGKYFGKLIIDGLTSISKNLGAYKTILDCNEKNTSFYKAMCGYVVKEYQMVMYHNRVKTHVMSSKL